MEELPIHKDVKDKLSIFIEEKKIPHIIFYGPSGTGKYTQALYSEEECKPNYDWYKKGKSISIRNLLY